MRSILTEETLKKVNNIELDPEEKTYLIQGYHTIESTVYDTYLNKFIVLRGKQDRDAREDFELTRLLGSVEKYIKGEPVIVKEYIAGTSMSTYLCKNPDKLKDDFIVKKLNYLNAMFIRELLKDYEVYESIPNSPKNTLFESTFFDIKAKELKNSISEKVMGFYKEFTKIYDNLSNTGSEMPLKFLEKFQENNAEFIEKLLNEW